MAINVWVDKAGHYRTTLDDGLNIAAAGYSGRTSMADIASRM